MGILRYGDPDNPDDRKTFNGMSFELDMIVTSPTLAKRREEQLYQSGYYVVVELRNAPPEESFQHLHNRGDPSMHIPTHLDGRLTPVWDIWVSTARRKLRLAKRRIKKSSKIKVKRKSCRCK